MSDIEDGITIIPIGKPCWGCIDLLTEKIPMVGEDFYCAHRDSDLSILIGRIRKIMDGCCIVPREITKGCYCGKR
jgi:hypothetical protein